MTAHLDEAEKQILGALLVDFNEQELGANELKKGYKGPKLTELNQAICTDDDITQTDFDIAFKDLEKKKLIKTGPLRAYENQPGSNIFIAGMYSLREYVGLTELGYKTARKAPNRPANSQRIVNNVHISGGQFTNMQLAAGETITQRLDSTSGADGDILVKLIEILEKQGQIVSTDQRNELIAAIHQAKEGNGKTAKSLLEKVCGPAWDSAQPVMWPILGELLKQSLGL
jgi:hypothetical protein